MGRRLALPGGLGLLAVFGACECYEGGPVERLARATPYALLEARLSGPFPEPDCPVAGEHAPPLVCPFPAVGTRAFDALADVSSDIESTHGRASALSELLWSAGGLGSLPTATEELAAWAIAHPQDPDAWSDRAAAELTRSAAEGRTYPGVLALDAARRALALDPAHAPARYNRALALDRLGFADLAVDAWSDYLEVDPSSAWAGSARDRRARLRQGAVVDDVDPVRGREMVLDSLLPAWGGAALAGEEAEARRLIAQAKDLAEGLPARSVGRAVADVERIGAGSPPDAARMARALQDLGEGRRHYRARRDDLAEVHFTSAIQGFAGLSRDLRDWASVWLASTESGLTRYDAVEERLAPIMSGHDPVDSPVLVGLAGWLRGVANGRRGRYGIALRHHQAAVRSMALSGEAAYTAFLWALVAEDHTLLGNPPEAWEARRRSFEVFRRTEDPGLFRGALTPAVDDLRRSGLLHAALDLQNHAVSLSQAGMAPNVYSEDLVRRANLLRELDRPEDARRDLVRARQAAATIRDSLTREWSLAEVRAAEGILVVREFEEGALPDTIPRRALALLDSAVAFHAASDHAHFLVDLHLERSRWHGRWGDPEDARRELVAALALVEETRTTIDDPSLGVRFAEASRGLWEAGLELDLVERGDPWSGLGLMERIRGLTTPWLDVPAPADLSMPESSPDDLAIVAYASLEDSLFAWVLGRSRAESLALPVSGARLDEAAESFGRAARGARSPEELWPSAVRMRELVLPDTLLELIGGRDVAFVPDPRLAALPFAALAGRDGWLLEERAVSVAPSVALLLSRLREPRGRVGRGDGRALVIADPAVGAGLADRYPSLPAAAREVATLRRLYPEAEVLQGPEAHPEAFVAGLQGPTEILHVAGHAVSAADVPGGSHLVLAPAPAEDGEGDATGGLLYAHALARTDFHGPELVVLTACSSVAPRPGSLGGFQGVALPFLERGTSAVVGTLWEVEDQGAARIATHFHEGWARGLPAREALRRAQLGAIREGDVPARVWAAFQLVGTAENPRVGSVPSSERTSLDEGGIDGV